jgi:DNA-binding MarR family transcriptional regulator
VTVRSRRDRPEEIAVARLPARLVFSLCKAAARVATSARMPMAELLGLMELAYFEEVRRQHPRELGSVAEQLGLSLRSVGTLHRRLKEAFFAAERSFAPARRLTALLVAGPRSLAELTAAAPELEPAQVRRALRELEARGWVTRSGGRYALVARLRSYVDEQLSARIDALNNQMEIIASSVWARFVEGVDTAIGRSWVFAARTPDLQPFIDQTVRALRHGAIDLEESALAAGTFARFAVTVSFAPIEDTP